MKGMINTYTCPSGHVTVTIDTDEGTTPMMLRCRQRADNGQHNCTEMATSAWYRCDQSLTPEYEWYKPTSLNGFSRDMKEHIKMGGLELRKLPKRKKVIEEDDSTLFDDILKDPHEVSKVKCGLCNHEWIAVRPEGIEKLECPNCHNISHFENLKN